MIKSLCNTSAELFIHARDKDGLKHAGQGAIGAGGRTREKKTDKLEFSEL